MQSIHKPLSNCSSCALIKDRQEVSSTALQLPPNPQWPAKNGTVLRNLTVTMWPRQAACQVWVWVCKPCRNAGQVCMCAAADPNLDLLELGGLLQIPAQHQLGALGSHCCSPHWAKGVEWRFQFQSCQSSAITETHSFLTVTQFLSYRQINSRDSKPGTKHWHIKKHIDKPSLSSSQEFGDSGNVSFVEESSPASKLFFFKGPHFIECLAATGYSPEYCIILVIGN